MLLHTLNPDNLIRLLKSGSPLGSIRRLLRRDKEGGFSPKPHIYCEGQWQAPGAAVLGAAWLLKRWCLALWGQNLPLSELSCSQHDYWHSQNSSQQWLILQGAHFHPPYGSKTTGSSPLPAQGMQLGHTGHAQWLHLMWDPTSSPGL